MPTYASLTRHRINRQGYDRDGRYFGVDEPLYKLTVDSANGYHIHFLRAATRGAAVIAARQWLSRNAPGYDVRS